MDLEIIISLLTQHICGHSTEGGIDSTTDKSTVAYYV